MVLKNSNTEHGIIRKYDKDSKQAVALLTDEPKLVEATYFEGKQTGFRRIIYSQGNVSVAIVRDGRTVASLQFSAKFKEKKRSDPHKIITDWKPE